VSEAEEEDSNHSESGSDTDSENDEDSEEMEEQYSGEGEDKLEHDPGSEDKVNDSNECPLETGEDPTSPQESTGTFLSQRTIPNVEELTITSGVDSAMGVDTPAGLESLTSRHEEPMALSDPGNGEFPSVCLGNS